MSHAAGRRTLLLLLLGVIAAALYTAIVDIGGELTPGYSHVADPVSALYQRGAPLGLPIAAAFVAYNALLAAFGAGVIEVAATTEERRRTGIAAGIAIVLVGVAGAVDAVVPQDPIGTVATVAGTLHIVFAGVAALLSVLAIALAAWWLLGARQLRPLGLYSIVSFVVIVVSGPVGAAAAASGSPVMGLVERVTIFTFVAWIALVSVVLARREIRRLATA